MELCEPLEGLIDLAVEFHGYDGERFAITIITTHERPPHAMGFRLMDDDEIQPAVEHERGRYEEGEIAPVAPEDEVAGMDIGGEAHADAGQAIEGQLVFAPNRGDHLNVNGIELFPASALVSLREACSFYDSMVCHSLESGGKERCFKRFVGTHQEAGTADSFVSSA